MSLTIHGTPASSPSDITRATFRATLRAHLADTVNTVPDPYTWSDDTLNKWIDNGLDELSRHVPKRQSTLIAMYTGSDSVDLGDLAGLVAIERVEYPAGLDPRSYLARIDHLSDAFGPGAYDFHPPATLLLGDDPTTGENLRLSYLARRTHPSGDSAIIDLPAQYHHALREWIVWQSVLERRNDEMQAPTENSLLLSLLDGVAMHHERTYQAALKSITGQAQATVSPRLPDRWRGNPWA